MAKQKRQKITSPKGVAKFPRLNTPDTKFNADGEYKVSLLLDPAENQEFLDKLDELADAALKKAKEDLIEDGKKAAAKKVKRQDPYSMEVDQEGEETGKAEVKFKMKARVKTRKGEELELTPHLFDARGKKLGLSDVRVTGGSVIKVNFTPSPYYVAAVGAGVSLQLNAVQILELAESGGDASFFGFSEEEGGFEVSDDDVSSGDAEGGESTDGGASDIGEEDF